MNPFEVRTINGEFQVGFSASTIKDRWIVTAVYASESTARARAASLNAADARFLAGPLNVRHGE